VLVSVERSLRVTCQHTYPALADSRRESSSSRPLRCGSLVSHTGHLSIRGTRSCAAFHLEARRERTPCESRVVGEERAFAATRRSPNRRDKAEPLSRPARQGADRATPANCPLTR
jgi:hypothetical protein